MISAVNDIQVLGASRRYAYEVLGIPRATAERYVHPRPPRERPPRPTPPRALSAAERQAVVEVLTSPRFIDQPPAEIYPALLDEGTFLCSTRTMYRILAEDHLLRERRNVRTHPVALIPSASAAAPNEVWVWDITKLKGPVKWGYFHLYVLLDLFSRYIVGWLLASHESASHAARLISESCQREGIEPLVLTLHSDRGAPMTSKTVSQLLVDLDVDPSYSRPRVSDDNAFAEAAFKTLKYQPRFPEWFGSLQEATAFVTQYVAWYNHEHYHSGLCGLTPSSVHTGAASSVLARRQAHLEAAYRLHPERFVNGPPVVAHLPPRVYLVPPRKDEPDVPRIRSAAAVRRTSSQLDLAQPHVEPPTSLPLGDPSIPPTPRLTHLSTLNETRPC